MSLSPQPWQSCLQDEISQHSLQNPEEFWSQQADRLYWHERPKAALRTAQSEAGGGAELPTWEWFPGGKISTCYNCVDRHVAEGHGQDVAIFYDSPVTQTKETYTYSRLLTQVETLAAVLRNQGVKKGDVVMLYSEYRPEGRPHLPFRQDRTAKGGIAVSDLVLPQCP